MAIFNSYVSLPEGKFRTIRNIPHIYLLYDIYLLDVLNDLCLVIQHISRYPIV